MNRTQAKERGCTCEWVLGNAIIHFDTYCPVLHLHYGFKLWNAAQLAFPQEVIDG